MKYQKVRALIVGFVFSTAAMSACGVYGSMPNEAYTVYGSVSSDEGEWGDNETGPYVPSRDGFDIESCQTVTIDGSSFYVPEYMTEVTDSEAIGSFLTRDCYEARIFQPEDSSNGTFALLIIRTGSISKLWESHKDSPEEYDPDGDCEYLSTILDSCQILDLEQQHFLLDTNYSSHIGSMTVITTTYDSAESSTETAGDTETTAYDTETADDAQTTEAPFANTGYFCLSNAYYIDPDNMDRFVCVTLYQSLDPNCMYNYNSDFAEIIRNASLSEN